jgi:hypothetical protein
MEVEIDVSPTQAIAVSNRVMSEDVSRQYRLQTKINTVFASYRLLAN